MGTLSPSDSLDILVIGKTVPSGPGPSPACQVEQYSLYAIVSGSHEEVLRLGYNLAEVWQTKDLGAVVVRRPTPEELAQPDFRYLSLISNEVRSEGYRRNDPFAEEKLQRTIAGHLKKIMDAVPEGTEVNYHFVGESCEHSKVDDAMIARMEAAAEGIDFVPALVFTESIPPVLNFFDENPDAN